MKIVVSGSTGLVGKELCFYLKSLNHEVLNLSRTDFNLDVAHLAQKINGSEIIIHLSGEPILQRWTPDVRKRLIDSRVETTKLLAKAILQAKEAPTTFLVASAVGIYSSEGINQEDQYQAAPDFLGHLVQRWEEASQIVDGRCRIVNMRFGVILSDKGGAIKQMLPIFKLGLGGKIGNGKQPFPWIHLTDVIKAMIFIINSPSISGPVNFVAPQIVNNHALTRTLSQIIKKPALFNIPKLVLKLMYGEAAETLLKGQMVNPKRLIDHGFVFSYPSLDVALAEITSKSHS